MKSYKEFGKMYIGASDNACLTVKNFDKKRNKFAEDMLYFGEDGEYSAYITYGDVSIGDHYKLMHKYSGKIVIADDEMEVFVAAADSIEIYQAGEFGCVIHLDGNDIKFGRLDIAEFYSIEDGEAKAI